MLTEEKKIGPHTPIVTSVHPLQIIGGEIPMTEHDIPLTAIVTPEEIVDIKPRFKRAQGIYREVLPAEKIKTILVLKVKQNNARF